MSAIGQGDTKSHLGPRRKRVETPITAADALAMLQSALAYCQRAGLTINHTNDELRGLTLYLVGCKLTTDDGKTRFVLAQSENREEKKQ